VHLESEKAGSGRKAEGGGKILKTLKKEVEFRTMEGGRAAT